jgi:F420-non-reducing hydrogenase iron-sulfur subunit
MPDARDRGDAAADGAGAATDPPVETAVELGAGEAGAFEPTIVAFFCNWCTYLAADLAGTSRMKYAPNARVIRVMCSGRIDPQFVLDTFSRGADGVLIGGCHPGDCHYQEGNYKALRRFRLMKRLLTDLGVEPERLRLEWISAAEADRLRDVMNEMTEQLRALGPADFSVPDEQFELPPEPEPGATPESAALEVAQ